MANDTIELSCGCSLPTSSGWVDLVDPMSDAMFELESDLRVTSCYPHESPLWSGRACDVRSLTELFSARSARLLEDRARVVWRERQPSSILITLPEPGDPEGLRIRARACLVEQRVRLLLTPRGNPAAEPAALNNDDSFWQLFEAAPIPLAVELASDATGPGHSRVNRKFTALFGYDAHDVPSVQHWWPLAYPDPTYRDAVRTRWFQAVRSSRGGTEISPMETTVVCKDGSKREIAFGVATIGERHVVTFVDLTESKRAERALRARVDELARALEENRRLRGLMPLCAWCRKLRSDRGYWLELEDFLAQHGDITVTHGICPECRARHFARP
jgi:PAS domain S-box-containing protein